MNARSYPELAEQLQERGIDVDAVKGKLRRQHIETPSWGYSNSGTRFKTFPSPGAARNIEEKLQDAGYVHRLTGVAGSVAIHIPWDKTDDWTGLKEFARHQGVAIGAVNPNLFQDEQYKLGSITNASSAVRENALAHLVECCEIMRKVDSNLLSLWFADGTNYAGQDNIRERKHRAQDALAHAYQELPEHGRMLIEYKFFEPAFYHTDFADWGMAYAMALKLGPRAEVLVDTGHHAQGTNIAHIVAILLDEGRLGGFHFNARRYADDDLIVGSNNPQELFEIFVELVEAGDRAKDVAYMIDQAFYLENKIEGMVLSVINCQMAYAKALIVNYDRLHALQAAGDVLGAHEELMAAFQTDVRPLLAQVRLELGIHPDPIKALRSDDYIRKAEEKRGTASGAGGGFPHVTASDELAALLEEQKAYYRARAAEYDQWFYRQGRYDHGPELNARWAAEAAEVRAALLAGDPVEHALELASGTGIWTQELLRLALRVTALDASSEMIAINRAKVASDRVTYRQVDLFAWQPEATVDLTLMGFWLSHVPPDRLAGHLATVRRALRPGGRLFLVDSRPEQSSTAKDTPIDPQSVNVQTRRLSDGSTFRVLKTYFEPAALAAVLTEAGFEPRINTTEHYFIYGEAFVPKENAS